MVSHNGCGNFRMDNRGNRSTIGRTHRTLHASATECSVIWMAAFLPMSFDHFGRDSDPALSRRTRMNSRPLETKESAFKERQTHIERPIAELSVAVNSFILIRLLESFVWVS